ncbi:MAG TPA: phosphatidylglycerophosphatase A [Casimicrobiaceae bacterium]|nr:phosphatidylglycerophosphatase A [Casimicrobiaceae bacterium]
MAASASDVPTPNLRFLLAHPAHSLALGFGLGLVPFAPGTFGTLLALPIAWGLYGYASDTVFLIATALLLIAGTIAAHVTGRDLRAPDHGSIVIDETVAFLFVLFFTGPDLARQALAFVLFRVFDIVKPPPIRQADAAFKNGFGVMFDDLLAAAYTLLALAIAQRVLGD